MVKESSISYKFSKILYKLAHLDHTIVTERKKDFQGHLLNQPISSPSPWKNILFTESIMNPKSSSLRLRESLKFLIGEISPLQNSTNWRMWARLSKENSAEFSLAPKITLKPRMLGKESKLNFLTKSEDYTIETKLETSPLRKHTKIITTMKFYSLWHLAFLYWEVGNQTFKSGTISIPKDSWNMMEALSN